MPKSSSLGMPVTVVFVPADILQTQVVLVRDGATDLTPVTVTQITSGVYKATFSPSQTGFYSICTMGVLAGEVEVVDKDLYSYLRDLTEDAFGSWAWDKTTNEMVVSRRDGSQLVKFSLSDGPESASRTPIL